METAVEVPHEENRDGGSAFPDEILPDYKDYIQFPISILFLTLLYCGEAASALYLFDVYRKNNDIFWMSFTIGFLLVGVVLDQAVLLLFQKDLIRHKFLFVGHILLLGPVVRCLYAMFSHYRVLKRLDMLRKATPLSNKKRRMLMEREIIHAIHGVYMQCKAFNYMSVVQAFLSSIPQLTLQLYVTLTIREWPLEREMLMVFSLISVTYGAIHCNILAMQLKYDNTDIKLHLVELICVMIWRSLEITSRVVILVLFIGSLKLKSMPFIIVSFSISLLIPWVEFLINGAHLPKNINQIVSQTGRILILIMITVLNAAINLFCWSGVNLQLSSEGLIDKKHTASHRILHYGIRLIENVMMVLIFKFTGERSLLNCCDSLIATHLITAYLLSMGFMLLFYHYLYPGWSGDSSPEEIEMRPEPT
ncbi:XK-related protein 3 [Myotis myotis]|uniref:XK-related protein 3 n=1 Tax=Myotis myotis TaxID=51298 RepID=UPI00174CE3E3|nr:XK-related protein 3 [Myotis myotis]